MMLFDVACSTGRLLITDDHLLRVSSFGQTKWQVPCQTITQFAVQPSMLFSLKVTVSSTHGTYQASGVTKNNFQNLLTFFPGIPVLTLPQSAQIPHQPPPLPSGPNDPTEPMPALPRHASFPPPPPPGFSQPPQKLTLWQRYRSARKRTQFGIGCGFLIVLLAYCSMCSAISNAAGTSLRTALSAPTAPQDIQAGNAPITPTLAPTPTTAPTPVLTQPPALMQPPASKPTQPPAPPPTQVPPTGVNGNPWGYNFTPGHLIRHPNPDFCEAGYFSCVKNFWKKTSGYVVKCGNGRYSHSGGASGACSRDGGVDAPLYSH